MPLISSIGRRQAKVRVLIWGIYAALTLGALTMVYPFLLMVSGSTKTAVDTPDAQVIPAYLVDDEALYRKHMEGFFNESATSLQNAYGLWDASFNRLNRPGAPSPLAEDWRAFLRSGEDADPSWFVLSYLRCPQTRNAVPYNLGKLRAELLEETGGIRALNLKYGTSYSSASSFIVIPPNFLNRFVDYPDTEFLRRIERFCEEQPVKWRAYVSLANFYRTFLQIQYGTDIAGYNAARGTNFSSWDAVPVWADAAAFPPEAREDAGVFLREIVNPVFVRIDSRAAAAYRSYLRQKYGGDIAALNARHGSGYADFEAVPFPEIQPRSGVAKSDWKGFLAGWENPETGEMLSAPLEALGLRGPDFAFRSFLRQKYGTLDMLNAKLGTGFASWEVVPMPQREVQYEDFLAMRGWLKWQFTIRNYVDVWNYLVINGRGLINTVIFCALSVLAALTVDPIAAYALSRFRPRSTYKVLLFLMMTMAFPAMVTQIPMFLLLRDLGLLNTFWALVLPGIANGYHIFLLKGFFDSLPKELFESAEIDGASELTIFLNITMALSKPILAVIALGAFTGAYAAFMFALLLCQDPKMWTLMVWLYQLQQNSGQGIIYASLIIAAIPTLVVFVACQNVIMRGIVVPVEK